MFKKIDGFDLVCIVGILSMVAVFIITLLCALLVKPKKDEHQVIHATYATIIVEHVPNYDGITTNTLKPIELPRLKIEEE